MRRQKLVVFLCVRLSVEKKPQTRFKRVIFAALSNSVAQFCMRALRFFQEERFFLLLLLCFSFSANVFVNKNLHTYSYTFQFMNDHQLRVSFSRVHEVWLCIKITFICIIYLYTYTQNMHIHIHKMLCSRTWNLVIRTSLKPVIVTRWYRAARS